MTSDIIHNLQEDIKKTIDHLHHELSTLRTGRANVGLLATVLVESYGTKVPLAQIASVNVADAKTLVISPWDKGQIQAIEKGIQAANIGLTPSNDGVVVRLNLPMMTEDRRKELVKLVSSIGEQSKISIRQHRENVIKAVKNNEDISDDESKIIQKKVQDAIDDANREVKSVCDNKEKEILTI